jgi:hypothetical protein
LLQLGHCASWAGARNEREFTVKKWAAGVAVVVAVLGGLAVGQEALDQCTLQSCRSFHELLDNKDPEIIELLKNPNSFRDDKTYVCLRSDEDGFFIAKYDFP